MGLHEYLQQVLYGPPGPQAVPYAEQAKRQIKEQLGELQQVFPSLGVRVSEFHTNDGRLLYLLKADGTIPIHYMGNKYNIPIVIWLTARYPDEAPLAYVVPTATMVIKAGHPHVDRNGQVTSPCVRNWKRQSSNLVELCLEMSHLFGSDPPLYSQPPGASNSSPNLGAQPHPSVAGPGAVARPPGASGPLPTTQPPPGYPMPPNGSYPSYSYNPPLSPGSSSGPPSGSGRPSSTGPPPRPGPGPTSYPINTTGASQPPPPPSDPAAALAASNPLWGGAYLQAQQASQAGAGPPGRHASSYSNPPPPGMGMGLGPSPSMSSNASASQQGGLVGGMGYTNLFGQPPGPGPYPASQPPYPGGYGSGRSNTPPPPPPPPGPTPAAVAAKAKPLLVQALKEQVEGAHRAWATHAAAETNRLLEEQRVLTDNRHQLQAVLNSWKSERAGTEGLVSEIGSKQAQLASWLDRNEPKAAAWREATAGGQPIDWEKVLPAADDVSKQALETQAADQACEDAVLALDKALQAGISSLTVDMYLKQVRLLCRRQYFARALGLKVADAQRQMAVAPPSQPARPGPPNGSSSMMRPYPVALGDTWMHPADAARAAILP